MNTLREFLLDELQKRHMSARKFAKIVGVSHASITTHLNEDGRIKDPSVDFLIKLGKATNTNAMLLLAMAYPALKSELEALVRLPIHSTLRLEQIENLPPAAQELIDAFLISAAAARKGEDRVDDK